MWRLIGRCRANPYSTAPIPARQMTIASEDNPQAKPRLQSSLKSPPGTELLVSLAAMKSKSAGTNKLTILAGREKPKKQPTIRSVIGTAFGISCLVEAPTPP